MLEDGTYVPKFPQADEEEFNLHKEFFSVKAEDVMKVKLV
jgi:polyphosphate kinase